jgi:hypothetical protein
MPDWLAIAWVTAGVVALFFVIRAYRTAGPTPTPSASPPLRHRESLTRTRRTPPPRREPVALVL